MAENSKEKIKLAEEPEYVPRWNKVLNRDEFLKLYFDNLGVNESLNVEKLTNTYEIGRKKRNEKLHFAIIRTSEGDLSLKKQKMVLGQGSYTENYTDRDSLIKANKLTIMVNKCL